MAHTPRPADAGISIGQIFQGKYRVEEILGHGGMGVVARCTHLTLNEQVAVKMLRRDVISDRDAVERFMREAQAAVKLRSEYVARVSDVGTFENGVPYMVMEFLDGHDLGELLEEQGSVAAQWATELIMQTCEALAEAHSIGIVHRDVKPTNLFVTWRPDGTSLIKVLDFGISKAPMGTDMQLTQTQSLLGTPAYMSPEQMRSARLVDARTDIWSLGTVMYELLEGRRPFEAESFSEMCVKVAVDPPAPMVSTPPGLQHVVLRCLAKSPEQRYQSMAEVGRDLIPFARDPHQAAMLVERMQRMLGRRSAADWDNASGTGAGRGSAPNIVRDAHSAPVRMQSPIGAWHGNTPAGIVQPLTNREPSAPARAPSDLGTQVRRRSRLPMLWLAVVGVGIGIGAAAFALSRTGEDQAAQVAEPIASPEDNVATEPDKPDDTTAGAGTPAELTVGDTQVAEPVTPDDKSGSAAGSTATPDPVAEPAAKTPDRAAAKPRDKSNARSSSKAADRRPPKRPHKKHVKAPVKKDPPDEVVKPPDPPPEKKDPFSSPRPEKR